MFLLLCYYLYYIKDIINMGRKLLYKTKEERIYARKQRQKRYYQRNANVIRKKRMQKYYDTL